MRNIGNLQTSGAFEFFLIIFVNLISQGQLKIMYIYRTRPTSNSSGANVQASENGETTPLNKIGKGEKDVGFLGERKSEYISDC